MKYKPLELPLYLRDYHRYRHPLVKHKLVWFRKFRGRRWIYGQNFGDYLSIVVVGELLRRASTLNTLPPVDGRMLAIGSIIHFAQDNDIIWGSGVNGKMDRADHRFSNLDIRMLRGPRTKHFLEEMGIRVDCNVFGDPALLIPHLFPKLKYRPKKDKHIVIPNLNELEQVQKLVPSEVRLVSPVGYWRKITEEILTSESVITSSLHGLILAEVFGVPVRFVHPIGGETLFKYEDYLEGTGRVMSTVPPSFENGFSLEMGVSFPKPQVDITRMLESFPFL
ncbi:polysaccharide pyruvyl transferase family protein [Parapedobacter indicus]|uniref:Pyruvyltransferase n=1 Tax=Parapedobacter indicus TaxID=1477437 RepID=A0A1I3QXC7_9SPHI|nr:polysaccharide pyruvyl transferase family protein [Parapedobacter indicus]PPL00256.1 pyruvyl transferase [Parapedobacter indicus]SFJ37951.1 pyruvyltransferase [Parapedobacter indicus]